MLAITLPAIDDIPDVTLHFEHSLVSISKWESLHKKAFFGREAKTPEESESYVQQMVLEENPPEDFTDRLSVDDYTSLAEYINSNQSGTWFREDQEPTPSSDVITSELVYYWLIQFQIPFKPVDEWHFSRLMTLIKIAGVKQSKPKRMSKQAIAEQYRRLNAQRREQSGSAG